VPSTELGLLNCGFFFCVEFCGNAEIGDFYLFCLRVDNDVAGFDVFVDNVLKMQVLSGFDYTEIVNLAITNHTEHTLSEKVALLVGVNKHLKCNIGLVSESRMLLLPLTPP
jgi:hypothetical protein